MNIVSMIITALIAVILIWAAVRTWKNRGKCSGCGGDCSHCCKKL